MSQAPRERVFVSVNLAGQVVIVPAEEHQKQMPAFGSSDDLTLAPTRATKLDVHGHLKLPERIANYLRSVRP